MKLKKKKNTMYSFTFLIQRYKKNSLLKVKDAIISTLYFKYFILFILQNSFVYIYIVEGWLYYFSLKINSSEAIARDWKPDDPDPFL